MPSFLSGEDCHQMSQPSTNWTCMGSCTSSADYRHINAGEHGYLLPTERTKASLTISQNYRRDFRTTYRIFFDARPPLPVRQLALLEVRRGNKATLPRSRRVGKTYETIWRVPDAATVPMDAVGQNGEPFEWRILGISLKVQKPCPPGSASKAK